MTVRVFLLKATSFSEYKGPDHPFLVTPYFVDPNVTTYDRLFRGDAETWGSKSRISSIFSTALIPCQKTWPNGTRMVLDYWEQSIFPFLRACVALLIVFLSGVDASVKFRPLEHEVEELGPDFEEVWKKDYAQKPDKPLFWMSALAGYACASFILRLSHKGTADFPQISRRYRQSATSALEFLSYVDRCAIESQVIALSCRGILFPVDICTSLLMIYMLLPTSTAGSCLSELHASLCACFT